MRCEVGKCQRFHSSACSKNDRKQGIRYCALDSEEEEKTVVAALQALGARATSQNLRGILGAPSWEYHSAKSTTDGVLPGGS